MLFSNTFLLIAGATRLALGAPSEGTTFTFPEGSGVEGTVTVDTSRVEAQIELFTKAALEGAGVDGINSHNASIGHLVASTVASDPPTQKECDDCWSVCIPLCLLPPACIGHRLQCQGLLALRAIDRSVRTKGPWVRLTRELEIGVRAVASTGQRDHAITLQLMTEA